MNARKFPHTMNLLTHLEGFRGAVALNFGTGEWLDYAEFGDTDLRPAVPVCAQIITRYRKLNHELRLHDIAEHIVTATDLHYHIYYLVPQFDNVAIYLLANRYARLPQLMKALEEAACTMH